MIWALIMYCMKDVYPIRLLLNIRKNNGQPWRYADKIEIVLDKPVYYRREHSYKGGQYFIREDEFFKKLVMTRNKVRQKNRDFSLDIREEIRSLKLSKGCFVCGYKKCAECLCFDHRNPHTKLESVNVIIKKYISSGEKKKILLKEFLYSEIEKCDVLCANCHYEKTYINQDGREKLIRTYSNMEEFMKENNREDVVHFSIKQNYEKYTIERNKYAKRGKYIIPTN